MNRRTRPSRRLLAVFAAVVVSVGPLIGPTVAGAAVTAQIDGSGSTWAENAVNQWIFDVTSKGLQVVFTGSGSAQGRTDFRNDTTDFAVSDIGFQGFDPSNGSNDTSCQDPRVKSSCRPYVYAPIVAGGTSFPYQVRVGGRLLTNLRLSGETIAKIFTLKIINWDDPAITRDNNGHKLPDLPIIPVVDSEGSGSTAQFTRYLATEYPSIWKPFAGSGGAVTEYFPRKGPEIAEAGSDGIINFVTSAAGNGAIGYDQYSYALGKRCPGCFNGWPVAQLENKAGYFVAPTQYDVAVALTKAQIDMNKNSANYLLQNLNNVYTNPDKRTYPLSSYSYMIIPTSANDQRMSTPKRQTLADFIDWSICGGQAEIGPTGYSPLPINLAQASFQQMYKLHTADKAVQISNLNVATQCHNPTFWAGHPDGNFLAKIAPEPPLCDKVGQGPCAPGQGVGPLGNPTHGKPPPSSNGSPSPKASGSTSPSAHASASSSTAPGAGTSGAPGASSAPGAGGNTAAGGSAANVDASQGSNSTGVLVGLALAELVLLVAIPPFVAWLRRQRRAAR